MVNRHYKELGSGLALYFFVNKMDLPGNFNPTALGITSVEAMSSWCFDVLLKGYGPGEFKPTNNSAVSYELTYEKGLDGVKEDRFVLSIALKYDPLKTNLSLREWQKIKPFTSAVIPPAYLVAV